MKSECQNRGSEHVCMLFWCDDASIKSKFEIDINDNIYMSNRSEIIKHGGMRVS